jgi:hypothetical protein
MIQFSQGVCALVGRGEATELEKDLFDRHIITTVRYADPSAWSIATAAAHALGPVRETLAAARDRVAVVAVCEHGPVGTIEYLADATRRGFTSALRYPAGNPGSLAGVTCIAFGFRGPTLSLLMRPDEGVSAGLFMTGQWMQRGVISHAVLATCGRVGEQRPSRALLLSAGSSATGNGCADLNSAIRWLVSVPSEVSQE